MPLLIFELMR